MAEEFNRYDVRNRLCAHKKVLPGREFVLLIRDAANQVVRSTHEHLMDAVKLGIQVRSTARSASVLDYEGRRLVTPRQMMMLWAADAGIFGVGSPESPFIIRGPTVNPTCIEEYESRDFAEALSFAVGWYDDSWDDPYWVCIRAPNGMLICTDTWLRKLYHAEVRSSGGSITLMIIQPSKTLAFQLEDGGLIPCPEVLHSEQVV